jgi:hypothetical protein
MADLLEGLDFHLRDYVSRIADQELKNAAISWLNQSYENMKKLEKSGEAAALVAKATKDLTRPGWHVLAQKTRQVEESDFGKNLKGSEQDIHRSVYDTMGKFGDVLPTLIIQLRAEKNS